MKNGNKALLFTLGAAGAAVASWAFLVAPGRASEGQRRPFRKRNFAHRGLYDPAAGIPENSLAAFRAAAARGYGVELDTRLTRDGVVVISHDGDLTRMTGQAVTVEESTYAELRALRLQGTAESIPRFADAMDILCGAGVPVVVEVKPCARARRDALCQGVLDVLDVHPGDYCVESFDPFIVRWFRRHAPDLLRGQLTSQRKDLGARPLVAFLASRVAFNFLGRPQFIAHHVGKKSLSVRFAELLGAMRVCWTAHDRREEGKNDAVIFEHCRPPIRYL